MSHLTSSTRESPASSTTSAIAATVASPTGALSAGSPWGAGEWIVAISTVIILASEIITTSVSAVWATANLLHLGLIPVVVLATAVALPGSWLCYKVVQMALSHEDDFIPPQ